MFMGLVSLNWEQTPSAQTVLIICLKNQGNPRDVLVLFVEIRAWFASCIPFMKQRSVYLVTYVEAVI